MVSLKLSKIYKQYPNSYLLFYTKRDMVSLIISCITDSSIIDPILSYFNVATFILLFISLVALQVTIIHLLSLLTLHCNTYSCQHFVLKLLNVPSL